MSQPKYLQVVDYLKEVCEDKKPDSPVPSEREIAAKLDVSRMTARKAVEELCRSGWLYRDGNKGTFVAANRPSAPPPEKVRRILFMDTIYDPHNVPNISKALEVDEGEKLFRLVLLNKISDKPCYVEEIYASMADISDKEIGELNSFPSLDVFRNPAKDQVRLSPMIIPNKYAKLLNVQTGSPIIRKDEQIRRPNGRPYLYVVIYYHPNVSPI